MKISPTWGPEAARRRFKDKVPVSQLAKDYKVSESRIYQVTGVLSGNPAPKSPWVREASRMLQNNKSLEEVAKHFNLSTYRVQNAVSAMRRAQKAMVEQNTEQGGDMADRQFDPIRNYKHPETGALMNGVIIRCGVEGCTNTEKMLKAHGVVNPVHAAQVFRNKGWAVGKGPRADRCPEHLQSAGAYKAGDQPTTKGGKPVSTHPANQPSAPKPQDTQPEARPYGDKTEDKREDALANSVAETVEKIEDTFPDKPAPEVSVAPEQGEAKMSRAERRIVFSKLEDVYGDESTGYKKDWTDQKVADDLGVPVRWISEIRDENFGPAKNMAETARLIAEVRSQGSEIMKEIDAIKENMAVFDDDVRKFDDRIAAFDKATNDFSKRVDEFIRLYNSIAK